MKKDIPVLTGDVAKRFEEKAEVAKNGPKIDFSKEMEIGMKILMKGNFNDYHISTDNTVGVEITELPIGTLIVPEGFGPTQEELNEMFKEDA